MDLQSLEGRREERAGRSRQALTASRVPPLAVAVFAFGALTRIVGFLQNASLSGDEAMLGLNIGRRGFLRLLQPLDYGQVATIPFLWAERLLVLLGGVSGYSLRVVPLLAGIGLLWVLYRLAAEVTGRVEALVALALVGTAFPLIRYSVEVKPYIVDAFVATVLVWTGCRVAEDLGNRRNWLRLALGGVAAVLVSTPALLVSGAVAGGLAVTALRARRTRALVGLGAILTCWLAIFGVTYATWYAPNARAPYMRDFWSQAILRLGTPHLISRSWLGLEETGCTLTCWRGLVDVTPLLILLTCIGVAGIWRLRRFGGRPVSHRGTPGAVRRPAPGDYGRNWPGRPGGARREHVAPNPFPMAGHGFPLPLGDGRGGAYVRATTGLGDSRFGGTPLGGRLPSSFQRRANLRVCPGHPALGLPHHGLEPAGHGASGLGSQDCRA
jgi:Dolichyl-phosphate-mannose-protein mannosyltransferase